ncbi:alpha,alpha-trehalase [Ancylostoma caninum]|uniref:Trehalase n=1 Tax=Ancylostoma caninum TaxID=29170 RepID=A0A368GRA6_ANCCA|nr:alpha,alpha-trehalase [Ancylostoma caninum]
MSLLNCTYKEIALTLSSASDNKHRHAKSIRRLRLALLCASVNKSPKKFQAVTPQEIVWENEDKVKDKIQTCDQYNAPGRYMIYCQGKLLQAVMATQLYKDSKTFVDQPLKEGREGEKVLAEFERLFPQPVAEIKKEDVRAFVDANFDQEGHELKECQLADWSAYPKKFQLIKDPKLRHFAQQLNIIWKELCREVKPVVKNYPERFSLIYVPHPFVVPGGRFREFYYWDAYWIVKGLLISGMTDTAKSMILNFAHMINNYGFVPNGGRIYYLRRSQPPLFAPMVYEYYQATRDKDLIREMLPVIEKEYNFWTSNRSLPITVNGEKMNMFQYRTPSTVPRPESYREDVMAAEDIAEENDKRAFYQNIASAAESGWDFSARWFADKATLTSIETTNIIPVDLNAYICYNLHIMGNLHGELGNSHKSAAWIDEYIKFRGQFQKVFWVERAKGWYDYNLRTKQHNTDFYAAMAIPLFTQCYEPLSMIKPEEIYGKMEEMGVFSYTGGIPTSLQKHSGQQWDFPNGWSPLNHMIIEGLRKSDDPRLQQKAFLLAEKWLFANYHVYLADNAMWEKYDVVATKPRLGAGGEYEVQPGFGWTNGVALDLLVAYGDRLQADSPPTESEPSPREPPSDSSSRSNSCFTTLLITTVISSLIYVHNL